MLEERVVKNNECLFFGYINKEYKKKIKTEEEEDSTDEDDDWKKIL